MFALPARQAPQVPSATLARTATLSPAVKPSTPRPVLTTVPENSWPSTIGRVSPVIGCGSSAVGEAPGNGPSVYMCRSLPQMPFQASFSVTHPGSGGPGSGMSSTRMSRTP